jgi:predicted transcriptional regulator
MSRTKLGARCPSYSDVILPMQDPYMTQIVDGRKNYEFRKYRLRPSVKRIWFYRTAPHSSITHVCETLPAQTRHPGDPPLEENGLGNAEFNNRHKDWDGYDFAYKMVTVCELRQPITLKEMKEKHGFKLAPRGLVYLPKSISDSVDLNQQNLVGKSRFGLLLSLANICPVAR